MQNLLERAIVLSDQEELNVMPEKADVALLPSALKGDLVRTLEELEKTLISQALKDVNGVISYAARQLGVSRSALQYKIGKYKLEGQCREKP